MTSVGRCSVQSIANKRMFGYREYLKVIYLTNSSRKYSLRSHETELGLDNNVNFLD